MLEDVGVTTNHHCGGTPALDKIFVSPVITTLLVLPGAEMLIFPAELLSPHVIELFVVFSANVRTMPTPPTAF